MSDRNLIVIQQSSIEKVLLLMKLILIIFTSIDVRSYLLRSTGNMLGILELVKNFRVRL